MSEAAPEPIADPSPAPAPADPSPAPVDPAPVDPMSSDPAPADPAPADPPQYFFSEAPEDWREQLVGNLELDDDVKSKMLNYTKRYNTLEDMAKAGFEHKQTISRGEISSGLPEDPTDEQLSEYREAHGIPSTPDEYSIALDEGLEFADSDGRIMPDIQAVAHKHNIPDAALTEMTNAMLRGRQQEIQMRYEQDGLEDQQCQQLLSSEWGNNAAMNKNVFNNAMNKLPEALKAELEGARGESGRALLNNPQFVMWLTGNERQVNPAGTITDNMSNPTEGINTIIQEGQKMMREDIKAWHANPEMQKKYMEAIAYKKANNL